MLVRAISLFRPAEPEQAAFVEEQRAGRFSYPEQGMSKEATDGPRYVHDEYRILLGRGQAAFERARDSILAWDMFALGWIRIFPKRPAIRSGETVGVFLRVAGLWFANACRIVYVEDVAGPVPRFAFAYGTLTAHAEMGEERFCVEWERDTDCVWYAITALSRPNRWFARLGYPLVRLLQRSFADQSLRAMAASALRGSQRPAPRAGSEGPESAA